MLIICISLQMVFEGTVGTSFTGDIAFDDIQLYKGICPDPGLLKL